jgi:hypothetical protein
VNNVKIETSRKALLSFIDGFREKVEHATDLRGEWKTERPSIRSFFQNPLPPKWVGINHMRFTLTVDLLGSQFIEKGEENE